MREIWVQSLGQEDPLKKEMATHSSTLAWRIPWAEEEEPGKLQSMGSQRVGQDWVTSLSLSDTNWESYNSFQFDSILSWHYVLGVLTVMPDVRIP